MYISSGYLIGIHYICLCPFNNGSVNMSVHLVEMRTLLLAVVNTFIYACLIMLARLNTHCASNIVYITML